jgi:hypothetical protein
LVSLDRLRRLEACEARADVQERHIDLLQKQIAETDAALKLELARGEKHAEAMMHVARTCDERTSEIKEQHAIVLRIKDAAIVKVEAKLVELTASHAAAINKSEAQDARHKEAIAALKAENAALKAQAASTLTEILSAVTAVTTGAMEILPVRPDRRQFLEWRGGGIPPPLPPGPPRFDRAWCAAVCGGGWAVDIDATVGDMRAQVTHAGPSFCTLRSALPLPRGPLDTNERLQQPRYRVIVEAYGAKQECRLGLLPSHYALGSDAIVTALEKSLGMELRSSGAIAPGPKNALYNYGGWSFWVTPSDRGGVPSDTTAGGWTVMAPADSAYATTIEVPPVPAGGAVEFAVDYAAGTCRVAFYTPAAVAGGFVEAPHAKMELRFVATAAGKGWTGHVPPRTVPTAATSDVALYPAVSIYGDSGNVWRFAA